MLINISLKEIFYPIPYGYSKYNEFYILYKYKILEDLLLNPHWYVSKETYQLRKYPNCKRSLHIVSQGTWNFVSFNLSLLKNVNIHKLNRNIFNINIFNINKFNINKLNINRLNLIKSLLY